MTMKSMDGFKIEKARKIEIFKHVVKQYSNRHRAIVSLPIQSEEESKFFGYCTNLIQESLQDTLDRLCDEANALLNSKDSEEESGSVFVRSFGSK